MTPTNALIFGYNDYTMEIEKNIRPSYETIHILKLGEDSQDGFDLGDNWDELDERIDIKNSIAFCILEDTSQNIFLTISLRDSFPDLTIIALAQDNESSTKLKLAGASRVIPTTQTTANVIVDMLEKPIVTEVLHDILYEKSTLKIAEIKIREHTMFEGEYPADIEWSKEHGVIIISIVHEDMSKEFIYSTRARHHIIKAGDIFVVVGYQHEIDEFVKMVGE